MQVAISTFLLNHVVALNRHQDEDGKARVLSTLISIMPLFNDSEAIFRTLVALGTVLSDAQNCSVLATMIHSSEPALNFIKNITTKFTLEANAKNKIENCSKELMKLLA